VHLFFSQLWGSSGHLPLLRDIRKKKRSDIKVAAVQGKCETPCENLVIFHCCLDVVGWSIHVLQFHTLSLIKGYSESLIWGCTSYVVLRYWRLVYEIHPDEGPGLFNLFIVENLLSIAKSGDKLVIKYLRREEIRKDRSSYWELNPRITSMNTSSRWKWMILFQPHRPSNTLSLLTVNL